MINTTTLIKLILLNICFVNAIQAQDSSTKDIHKNSGFLDFNGYYDTRDFSVLTINALVNLPEKFQYFSLTNFEGAKKTSDFSTYYTEQNLRWNIKKNTPFDLTFQWVSRANDNNDDLRLGVRWRLHKTKVLSPLFEKLNLSYAVNFHLLQFRFNAQSKLFTQLEHAYRINVLPKVFNNRLYIGGFADQNIVYKANNKITFKWVSEHQIGYNIINSLFVVLEYRINDFLPIDNYGLGYGLQYKIKF